MSYDILITNGKVIGPGWVNEVDIGIEGGKIKYIGNSSKNKDASRVIDASSKFISPGGIDPHTHFEDYFMGTNVPENWKDATNAAAFGGTTTVLDFAGLEKESKNDTIFSMVRRKMEHAKAMSVIDYSFKPFILRKFYKSTEELIEMIDGLSKMGFPGFKVFMAYRKWGIDTDSKQLYQIMKLLKDKHLILQIHAEDGSIEEFNTEMLLKEGKTDPIFHYESRPNYVENLAIQYAMGLAEITKTPTYIVHQSTKEGPNIISYYRNKGLEVFDETCTHYLVLDKKKMEDKKKGRYFLCSPPLRSKEDIQALWEGLKNFKIQVVGSDHDAFTIEQKEMFHEFHKVPNGIPGVETRLPLIFSEGVMKGKLSLQRFAEVTSTNAAKIFGLYPKKGTIQVNSDADLVIIDPKKRQSLDADDLHTATNLSVYEGMTAIGWPVCTISRGEVIIENEIANGKTGRGEFLQSKIDDSILRSAL